MVKRIITGLRIEKIATVDKPSQEGATARIMKRDTAGDVDALGRFTSLMERLRTEGHDDPVKEAASQDAAGHAAWLTQQAEIRANMEKIAKGGFEAIASAIQKRDGCTGLDALRKAREEFPQQLASYQAEGQLAKAAPPPQREISKGAREFNTEVDRRAAVAGISKTLAMTQLRKERPDLYQAYNEA